MADLEEAVTEESPGQAAEREADGRTGAPRSDRPRAGMSRGSGQMSGTPKKDKTPIIIAVVSIIGVVVAWVSYTHSKNQAAAATAATDPTGTLGTGTVTGADQTTVLANMLTSMQDEISQLTGTIQLANTPPSGQSPTSSSTANPPVGHVATPPAGKAYTLPFTPHGKNQFIAPGTLNQRVSLRSIAQKFVPSSLQSNPTAVEQELRYLDAANPGVARQGYMLGGHVANLPTNRRTS